MIDKLLKITKDINMRLTDMMYCNTTWTIISKNQLINKRKILHNMELLFWKNCYYQ